MFLSDTDFDIAAFPGQEFGYVLAPGTPERH
jgi:hypothetical protein